MKILKRKQTSHNFSCAVVLTEAELVSRPGRLRFGSKNPTAVSFCRACCANKWWRKPRSMGSLPIFGDEYNFIKIS